MTLAVPVAAGAGLWMAYRRLRPPSGEALNRLAWEASFSERGLPVPAGGPRDGYWGARMPGQVKDPEIGWHEAEAHMPGLVEEDAAGVQRLETPGARAHLVIIGGSVAWGAYASTIEATYFARLARWLATQGWPVRVSVLAAGAWTSEHEVVAVRSRGLDLAPDVVLILDGLNDLTLGTASDNERIGAYLERMHEVRDRGAERGVAVVFALQPTILDKRRSAIEERVLALSLDPAGQARVRNGYGRMRVGLRALARSPGVAFVDCSGAFDREQATTFTDLWHFADPGHALLAAWLGPDLLEVLRAREPGATRPPS